MEIIRAEPADAETLTRIAVAAKAYWGYPPEWMERWATLLTLTPEKIRAREVYKAQSNGEIFGFYSMICREPAFLLDDLWIEPRHIRQGIGRQLCEHAIRRAKELGAKQLELEAEPHAIEFYEKMGAQYVRDTISDFGRVLPIMGINL